MPLEIDVATIAFQLINFTILAVFLYRVLFRPMMERVEQRAREKARLVREMTADRQEAARLRSEMEDRLTRIDEEATAIVAGAREKIEMERVTLLEEVQSEVEAILEGAQVDASGIRRQVMDEFHDDLLDTVLAISGQVLQQTAPSELHDALVQQITSRIWELGRSEMDQVEMIRRSLADRAPTVHAVTAHPLSTEQQGQLVRTFSALADHNVNLEIETDAGLIMGLRVRLGDMVVDNSVSAQLEDLRETVSQALSARFSDD
jgi:F-type H+-transporting ATPase subunit b